MAGNRAIMAVVGSLVGDAAAMPLHWVYDQAVIDAVVAAGKPLAFGEPACPFYRLPVGKNTSFADVILPMLIALEKADGKLVLPTFHAEIVAQYGPGTPYEEVMKLRDAKAPMPHPGPWLDGVYQDTLRNIASGAEPTGSSTSKDPQGFCAALPVIAVHINNPDVLGMAKEAITALTTGDVSVVHGLAACHMVLAAIKGDVDPIRYTLENTLKPDPMFKEVVEETEAVLASLDQPHTEMVKKWGVYCGYPGSFQGALHAVLTSRTYEETINKCIAASGSSGGRSSFAGALAGALYGDIPQRWIEQTDNAARVRTTLTELQLKF